MQHLHDGQSADAERIARQALVESPTEPGALFLAGVVALQLGRLEEAVAMFRCAVAAAPGNAEYHLHLGETYRRQRHFGRAVHALVEAVSLNPDLAAAQFAMGLVFHETRDARFALRCFERVAELQPAFPDVQRWIAAAKSAVAAGGGGSPASAMVVLAGAFDRLGPRHEAMAGALFDEAIVSYQQALATEPGRKDIHRNLANVLARCGRVDEATQMFKEAVSLEPDDPALRSLYLLQLQYAAGYDARTLLEEAREWDIFHGRPLALAVEPHENDRSPDRRLRIGYVSPSFNVHVHAFFLLPLLAHHDHGHFEIYCYSDVEQADDYTGLYRRHADQWRDVNGMDDARLAALIREDRIDVLVDLTMHTAGGRLLVFARKPAPVQIAWLAYPGTTGLSTMDYRITDPHLDPPGSDTTVYAEKSLPLPETFWCYSPLVTEASTSPLPARTNRHVRFGCLNNFAKVSDALFPLWARILESVPASKLVLRVPAGETRRKALATFARHGVVPERLEFLGFRQRLPYLATYRTIDVCLDTVPYNGHTTSLDASWMGVPVVTLVGSTVVGRAGLCLAMNIGMPELVAHSRDQYVAIAVGLATDLDRLAEIRATLRARMETSPLMDVPRFARNLEAAYRAAWREWCSRTL